MIELTYRDAVATLVTVYGRKNKLYGNSLDVLSFQTLVDLMHIKIARAHNLLITDQEPATKEDLINDIISVANYAAVAISRIEKAFCDGKDSSISSIKCITEIYEKSLDIFLNKNRDYNNAWQYIRNLGIVELIIMKIVRIKNMDDDLNKNKESILDNLFDIINYAVIYMIKQIQRDYDLWYNL